MHFLRDLLRGEHLELHGLEPCACRLEPFASTRSLRRLEAEEDPELRGRDAERGEIGERVAELLAQRAASEHRPLLVDQRRGEVVTGLLYVDESVGDLHELNNSSDSPLARLPFDKLCPGASALAELQEGFR